MVGSRGVEASGRHCRQEADTDGSTHLLAGIQQRRGDSGVLRGHARHRQRRHGHEGSPVATANQDQGRQDVEIPGAGRDPHQQGQAGGGHKEAGHQHATGSHPSQDARANGGAGDAALLR
jgi:hypothetical protein